MKTGRTIHEIAAELARQKDARRDFIADTRNCSLVNGRMIRVGSNGGGSGEAFPITDHAHRQIGSKVGVPAVYYDRMREQAPALLDTNINHWFQEHPERRMIRTLDGNARAYLSDAYHRVDNDVVFESGVWPAIEAHGGLAEGGGLRIASCEVTERRMYVKIVTERITKNVAVGQDVQAGCVISNSEIGGGAVRVDLMVYELRCLNGMVMGKGLRKHHVGGRAEDGIYEMLSDSTRQLDDKAFAAKITDVVTHALSETALDQHVAKMRDAAGDEVDNPAKTIELAQKKFDLTEAEGAGILDRLIKGGDASRLGIAQAITNFAQDESVSYDRATEMEYLGGQLINLPRSEWAPLARAA